MEAPLPRGVLVGKPAKAIKGDAFTRSVLSEDKMMYETRYA